MKSLLSIFLFLAGIALIFWAGKPLWEEIDILRAEKNSIAGTLSELRNLEEKRNNLLSIYNSISKSDLERLNYMLPLNSDTGSILVSLEKLSQNLGIRLKRAEFITENKNTQSIQAASSLFNTIDMSFIISASYDSFKSFLDALERNLRIEDITNISFSTGQTNLYEFTIRANSYYAKKPGKVTSFRDIGNVNIDTSFFSDPRFVGLELVPAPSVSIQKGRTNPFLPI
ncbi:MAG: hypothetical protein AAB522_02070 [Patescibacteria group bacterium]